MKFPDEYFEITGSSKYEYNKKLDSGKKSAKTLNVVFCATCKDVAKYIDKTLKHVHETGKMFQDYDIFLYENNSTDNTVDIIKQDKSGKVILETEFLSDSSYERSKTSLYKRCQLIAKARNKYVDYVNNNYMDYDYVFVFDADMKGAWSKEGVLNSIHYLESDDVYDCMTSYCIVGGCEDKPLEEIDKSQWLMFDSYAFRFFDDDQTFPVNISRYNYLKIEKGADPIRVDSNFNGLAIYRPKCFKDNFYSTKNYGQDNLTDIDHVIFHRNMKKKGMSVFMNPSMITSVSKHKYCKDN